MDPTQNPVLAERKQTHHIEKLFTRLQRYDKFRGRVLKIYLPGGMDPGEADRAYMKDLIRMYADEAKLPVSFKSSEVLA